MEKNIPKDCSQNLTAIAIALLFPRQSGALSVRPREDKLRLDSVMPIVIGNSDTVLREFKEFQV